MKAFVFRLEQALRWRETQVTVQQTRVLAATGRVAAVEAELDACSSGLASGAGLIASGTAGFAMHSYACFAASETRRIETLKVKRQDASKAADAEMALLIEANRKVQLMKNLKADSRGRWQKALEGEIAKFADEAFAAGYARASARSKGTIEK